MTRASEDKQMIQVMRRAWGVMIKERREKLGMTQKRLARILEMPQSRISIAELGGGSLDSFLSIVVSLDLQFQLKPCMVTVSRCDCGQIRTDGRWLESYNHCPVHTMKGCRFVASLESPNTILAREAEQKRKNNARRRRTARRLTSVDAMLAGMDEVMGARSRR